MAKTILVVDDKVNMRLMIKEYLTEANYRVATAGNGREALFVARESRPDLILLDIMMPEMDGYDFIRLYRQEHDTPIILLTAKLDEMDKVIGLELGADDYVTKPFGMRELVARIRAVLRRSGSEAVMKSTIRVGDLELDKDRREVTAKGVGVSLTPSEFDLLALLMGNPGRVYSRLDLLEHLQGPSLQGAERTIDVHIRNLRHKIEENPKQPRYVETVFGIGYRFCNE